MDAWYDEEANHDQQAEQTRLERAKLIQSLDLRSVLRRQTEKDIAGINANPRWAKKLNGIPLIIEDHAFGGGFDVVKRSHPQVFVGVHPTEIHISITRKFIENPVEDRYTELEEDLEIITKNDKVVLKAGSRTFLGVPEEASRYLLRPFIETLKMTSASEFHS